MIQPVEMRKTLPMALHGSVSSTTSEVWEMLSASRDGDLDRVTRLIEQRPELSTCQYNYTPPLHFAVREGHLALVRALVERKALDPNYKTYPFGDSFLTMAQDRGHEEIARFLQDALARPDLTRKWVDTGEIDYQQDEEQRRFDQAVHRGQLEEVERLLDGRPELAQVPAVSKWGRFYYFRHDDIAELLLENGMSPGHMSWQQVTLLHDMAQIGDIAKARSLLDRDADIDAIDDEYRSTPLGMAARWGHRETVAFLLERGADPNRSGAAWSAPLAWAQKKGHATIANDLLAAGAAS